MVKVVRRWLTTASAADFICQLGFKTDVVESVPRQRAVAVPVPFRHHTPAAAGRKTRPQSASSMYSATP